MLKKFIHRFLQKRHYWRDVSFDELSELYTSMMFRSLAQSLVGIFIPVYLYLLGFPVWQVLAFYAAVFLAATAAAYPVARIIARVGPKHTILTSYVFQVISLLMLISQAELQWPLLAIAIFYGLSGSLFFTAFHVDFSKIKHHDHGGKEMGWMYSMERIGFVLGPITGGLIGYFFDAQYIFAAGIVLLFIGLIPLFLTAEPTRVNQKLDFSGLNIRDLKFDLTAHTSLNLENTISVVIWPFFLSVYVLSGNPYVQLGSIVSISVLVSVFIARAIGRTIDRQKGRALLRLGASLNAGLHLFRPFTSGFPMALGINLANEAVTPLYRMSYLKGFYDTADDHPGKRIAYITSVESTASFCKAIVFVLATLLAYSVAETKIVFTILFIVGGLASLGIMLERFKALGKAR